MLRIGFLLDPVAQIVSEISPNDRLRFCVGTSFSKVYHFLEGHSEKFPIDYTIYTPD